MSEENGDQPGTNERTELPGVDRAKQPETAPETAEGGTQDQLEPDSDPVEQLRQHVRELEAENAELKDQYLRKSADFENFRKRMFRERDEAVKYANAGLLRDLITTIDDFDRAIKSSDDSHDFQKLHEGVELIEKQLTSMLENKYGLRRYESVGEPFDPEKHEAISVGEMRPEAEAQIVLEDYQKGFMLHDRILRPAKVKVSMEPPARNGGHGMGGEISGENAAPDGRGKQGE